MSNKHLTYDDRLAIQAGLQQRLKVAQIAKNIGKNRSTVSREIKAHHRMLYDARYAQQQYEQMLAESRKGIYSYIDADLLDARNIDLRRKLRRPERKKSGPVLRVDRKCHIGRGYEEYGEYMGQNPDAMVSQMDSVVIHKGGQTLLTILFTNCDLQLMFLRERNTAGSVTERFSVAYSTVTR